MPTKKKPSPSQNKSISISGDVRDSTVISGDNNTVNQTIIQKFFNIFKSDAETLEQRNRRILLGHVETAWIKGVLDASLHGAALLDLGIKQDPEAVTKYPWAIQKESTKETLPAGTSMLEIFDSIGMGRSLLILGAPGSGKTTMLLELTRGLIARAREDVTQPIPMVFNLASWTERLTLADWLTQELNNLYSVPRKTAPDWVKGNKLLLLLDGLDEVRQESRAKCVEAINEFRKQNGLTSLAVCSRSQDYADLNAKLSFEGAIEVQPLTQEQIAEFFNRFGDEMVGIKQALEKDNALHEMAETPLFLSIMLIAYRNKRDEEILRLGDEKTRHKNLFNTYIKLMLGRTQSYKFHHKQHNYIRWISWIAFQSINQNQTIFIFDDLNTSILDNEKRSTFKFSLLFSSIAIFTIIGILILAISLPENNSVLTIVLGLVIGITIGGSMAGASVAVRDVEKQNSSDVFAPTRYFEKISNVIFFNKILKKIEAFMSVYGDPGRPEMVDLLFWDWREGLKGFVSGLVFGQTFVFIVILFSFEQVTVTLMEIFLFGLMFGTAFGLILLLFRGLRYTSLTQIIKPGQRISLSIQNSFLVFLLSTPVLILGFNLIFIIFFSFSFGFIFMLNFGIDITLIGALYIGLFCGLIFWWNYGAGAVVRHYTLRFILARNNLLPWRLVPFLDHCVDLIFLRRVGGGYIFIHRLLMEHFAEMYVEAPTSKGS